MILEGFEIENWSCIKKLTVGNLPSTGVVVLHGPNRTGKSSLVQALRACLMDNSSSSNALKSYYPRGTGEKPTVSVTFVAGGATYRIKKCFGSNKSELASRTSAGAWKVETTSATEAHSRVCERAGGDDSNKGLRQLLWLTQAEFQLPDPKKFDAGVQAQLRGILGVLQTPLDDHFIGRVKRLWNEWHSGQRKAGKEPEIKDSCKLAQRQSELAKVQEQLNESELKFKEVEALLREIENLESRRKDLAGQLIEQERGLHERQKEHERCQERINARTLAEERFGNAEKEQEAAELELQQRADAEARLAIAEKQVQPGKDKVGALDIKIESIGSKQRQRRKDLDDRRDNRRELQRRVNGVAARLLALDGSDRLTRANSDLERAQGTANEIGDIEKHLLENTAPNKKELDELKEIHQKWLELRSERDAASMTLTVAPATGAGPAQLALDGQPAQQLANSSTRPSYPVRRSAELLISGWGQVKLTRGTSKGGLDQIETDLDQCQENFANTLLPFGIAPDQPDALDQILRRHAEQGLKKEELKKKKEELKKVAPQGLEPLQRQILDLQNKLVSLAPATSGEADALPTDRTELEKLKTDYDDRIELLDGQLKELEDDIGEAETNLGEERASITSAKEELAGFEATANARRDELTRCRTEEQITQRVRAATQNLQEANRTLTETELTADESTIDQRLAKSNDAVSALETQIDENGGKYNRIRGRLEGSEGMHARRASLSARVDELTRFTSRESIEKDAVDRLYELFEECREKQIGTLMGPIHDRVLNWMRVLDIGDYKEVRFNDVFLPDKLVRRDGTGEFTIDEESTGAQEQIGMLVRLALGSLLTSANEPTVAILDDPLTHCDVGRLNKMRAILRRAAEGDAKLIPPAGPLQIIVLTCHPEWFRDERATVIDLEHPDVMSRYPV